MAYRDLPEFIAYLDKRGVLRRVEVAVNLDRELIAIVHRVQKMPDNGPVLYFYAANKTGSRFGLLTNVFATAQRTSWSFGLNNLEQLTSFFRDLQKLQPATTTSDRLLQLGASSDLVRFAPRLTKNGVCQEVVLTNQDATFDWLPLPTYTADSNSRIMASVPLYYRDNIDQSLRLILADLNVISPTQALVTPHPFAAQALDTKGRIPVAFAFGGDPALFLAGLAPLPPLLDELTLAGFLRRSRIETVKCRTTDIEVPAVAELVLEGFLQPVTEASAFSCRFGFAQQLPAQWQFELTAITQRKQPVLPLSVATEPTAEAGLLKAVERALLPMVQSLAPEIVDLALPTVGGYHNLAVVSIDKRYAGQSQKVMHILWGSEYFWQNKILVLVDADCNIQDYAELMTRLLTTLQPEQALQISSGAFSLFDLSKTQFGSRLFIDATRPIAGEQLTKTTPNAKVFQIDAQIRELVEEKWPSYGID